MEPPRELANSIVHVLAKVLHERNGRGQIVAAEEVGVDRAEDRQDDHNSEDHLRSVPCARLQFVTPCSWLVMGGRRQPSEDRRPKHSYHGLQSRVRKGLHSTGRVHIAALKERRGQQAFAALVKSEIARWTPLIKAASIKM